MCYPGSCLLIRKAIGFSWPNACHHQLITSSTGVLLRIQEMECWNFLDERDLAPFCGVKSCSTCSSFGYVTLSQCQVLGACHLKKRLLPPGVQLIRRCAGWSHATPWAARQEACPTDVSCALVHHRGCVPRSEDPARDLNNEIAELEARVAHPMHWTNGEHQFNLTRLQQLIYEKQRRDKASASGHPPA